MPPGDISFPLLDGSDVPGVNVPPLPGANYAAAYEAANWLAGYISNKWRLDYTFFNTFVANPVLESPFDPGETALPTQLVQLTYYEPSDLTALELD